MKYFKLIGLLLFITCSACHWRHAPKVAAIEEKDADYYYNQGVYCLNTNNYHEALSCFDKAITMDSTQADYYVNRGVVKDYIHDPEGALIDAKKALSLDSCHLLALLNVGGLLDAQNNLKGAAIYYNKMLICDSTYYPAIFNLAITNYQLEEYYQAFSLFEKCLQYEKNLYSHYYIGMIYKKWGQMNQAKEHFELSKSLGGPDAAKELEKLK